MIILTSLLFNSIVSLCVGVILVSSNGIVVEDVETIEDQMQLPVQSALPEELGPGLEDSEVLAACEALENVDLEAAPDFEPTVMSDLVQTTESQESSAPEEPAAPSEPPVPQDEGGPEELVTTQEAALGSAAVEEMSPALPVNVEADSATIVEEPSTVEPAVPEVSSVPEESTAESSIALEPSPTPESAPTPDATKVTESVSAPEPTPVAEPAPDPEPEPVAEASPVSEPVPALELAATEPTLAAEPTPGPEPTLEVESPPAPEPSPNETPAAAEADPSAAGQPQPEQKAAAPSEPEPVQVEAAAAAAEVVLQAAQEHAALSATSADGKNGDQLATQTPEVTEGKAVQSFFFSDLTFLTFISLTYK